MRLDKALSLHPEIISRTTAQHLIESGLVQGHRRRLKPSQKTLLNETYIVTLLPKLSLDLTPQPMDLDIVFEDDDLLVINKPSGLVVHPSAGHWRDTLVHGLLYHTNSLAKGTDVSRPGIVHRIDKDTSGLLVVAKNEISQQNLSTQFKHKTVHRVYRTVCWREFKSSVGTVKTHLARHPKDRKRFASLPPPSGSQPSGKLAITHFAVKKFHPLGLSLVECRLETGRTHQIRVHLSELGHPIMGDPVYGAPSRINRVRSKSLQQMINLVPHLMLHAAELGFIHPQSKKELRFKVDWPAETIPLLKELRFLETQNSGE